jgi:hypothetical protein
MVSHLSLSVLVEGSNGRTRCCIVLHGLVFVVLEVGDGKELELRILQAFRCGEPLFTLDNQGKVKYVPPREHLDRGKAFWADKRGDT